MAIVGETRTVRLGGLLSRRARAWFFSRARRHAAFVALFGGVTAAGAQTNPKTQLELLEALQPLSDPIPHRIVGAELQLMAMPFVQAPDSEDVWGVPRMTRARIQYLLPMPGPGARLAFNDTRGILYVTDAGGAAPQVYLDLRRRDVGFVDVHDSGFMGFAFHPEFATAGAPGYGKLYTAFSAEPDRTADYAGEGAVHHSVIREWSAEDAGAAVFAGETRELLRVGQYMPIHGVGTIAFNPTATADAPDYGLLYIGFGDGGGEDDAFDNGQRLDTPLGAIARIDPLGGNAGAYGVPVDNPLAGAQNVAPEIWAWGLRHPQQFSWDAATGRMFIADAGQDQVEEINLGVAGGNYGWRLTEGTFATAMAFGRFRDPRGTGPMPVFDLPKELPQFVYPVAQYDHDDGLPAAVAGGFVYRGSRIPALRGKYLFTDIVQGKLFAIDSDGLAPGRPATIEQVRWGVPWRGEGPDIAWAERVRTGGRWDARLGIDHDGELYLLTKSDAWIRRLVPKPIPERVVRGRLRVATEPFVRAPASEDAATVDGTDMARAHIQYLLPMPGPGARLAFNDSRGILYVTDAAGAAPQVYLDLRYRDVGFASVRDVGEAGFMGFAFHPEFAIAGATGYGKLYTAFSAKPDGAADHGGEGAVQHSVIREWSAEDASAAVFTGETRELLRVGQFERTHGIGTIAFNSTATADAADYGLLYIGFGDGGGEDDPFDNGQRLDTPLGAIARIDPLGSNAGAYGIPADNPLAGGQNVAAEIWAWGLRHPQQFSWDAATGRMFIADAGEDQVEEINLGVAGGNYGWRLTEGTFATAMSYGRPRHPRGHGLIRTLELPKELQSLRRALFVYPVAQYGLDEPAAAMAGGFVYRGSGIPALRGKYLFTDVASGALFAIDSDGLVPGRPATIERVRLSARSHGERGGRGDTRLGIDHDGELYLLGKSDGWIRRLVPPEGGR